MNHKGLWETEMSILCDHRGPDTLTLWFVVIYTFLDAQKWDPIRELILNVV